MLRMHYSIINEGREKGVLLLVMAILSKKLHEDDEIGGESDFSVFSVGSVANGGAVNIATKRVVPELVNVIQLFD